MTRGRENACSSSSSSCRLLSMNFIEFHCIQLVSKELSMKGKLDERAHTHTHALHAHTWDTKLSFELGCALKQSNSIILARFFCLFLMANLLNSRHWWYKRFFSYVCVCVCKRNIIYEIVKALRRGMNELMNDTHTLCQ